MDNENRLDDAAGRDGSDLLPIGRFALATGLSVKALRHYAEIGLLTPARVDRHTGYRSYALGQIPQGKAIVRLRGLDVPLAEIARLLEADADSMRERLAAHRRTLAERVRLTQESLDVLDRIIAGEEALVPEKTIGDLDVRLVPEKTYVIVRDRRPMEELTAVIPGMIGQVAGWIFANGGPGGAPMARVDMPDGDGITELEVGWPPAEAPGSAVSSGSAGSAGSAESPGSSETPGLSESSGSSGSSGLPELSEPFEWITYPATRAVVYRHIGPYVELHDTYAALEKAIAAADLTPAGPARESYETNPDEEPDSRNWVTEIVWPVA